MSSLKQFLLHLRPEHTPVSHAEKFISAAGGFFGVLGVYLITRQVIGAHAAVLMIASMGSTAVLLFAVPHAQLSQPWPVLAGHFLSAIIGVGSYRYIPDVGTAAATAGGLSILVMYYLRCLHPPAGATALTPVLGDSHIHALGYGFVLSPVMLNVVVILFGAVVLNYFFAWRRYPIALMHRPTADKAAVEEVGETPLNHGDLEYALSKMGSYIDITEEELESIYALALKHAHEHHLDPSEIALGGTYSNGLNGESWSVRQVIDRVGVPDPEADSIIYRVVAGKDRRKAGVCTRAEFARWAKYEVMRNDTSWELRMRHPLPGQQLTSSPAAPAAQAATSER